MKKYFRKIVIPCTLALFFTVVVAMIDRAALHPQQEDTAFGSRETAGLKTVGPDVDTDTKTKGQTGPQDSETETKGQIGLQDSETETKGQTGPQDSEKETKGQNSQPDTEKKKVALTFDDGPDAECTPLLLDGLAKRGVKATFFVIGAAAEQHPDIMKRMVEEGHLIGNHTYNHVDLKAMTQTAARKEIKKANEIIAKYTGEEPCFLRPPFGSASKKVEKEMEMIQVLWTIDTMDWSCKDEASICSTVYSEIEENSIILMHDEYPTTVRSALSVIDCLQEKGYEFVTVDEIVMD